MLSLEALSDEWSTHALGRKRAHGGRVALSGFLYQLYLSLDRFIADAVQGNRGAGLVFEGLSDIAQSREDFVYLTQAKSTLDLRSARSAVEEAIAVSQFLSEMHPELQDRVRFQVVARRAGASAGDIGGLDATDLALDVQQTQLWAKVRTQFLPVQVCSSPKMELVLRLWPHANQCFPVVDALVGRLFSMLGENRSSPDIALALLEIWDRARGEEGAPCYLVGPRELVQNDDRSAVIVHGVRPRLHDLVSGCFMERPGLLEAAIAAIRDGAARIEASPHPETIPVFWVVGPSGSGKSVLCLQLMRELVLRGDVAGANYLGELAHALPRSLVFCGDAPERMVVVIDDMFAPENRDPRLWNEIAEWAFVGRSQHPPWILTCGPTEQLMAFRHETESHRELLPIEIPVGVMLADEIERYHSWYEARTGAPIALSREPVFVAAAWTYELRRRAGLSVSSFAARFFTRLRELGLESAVRTALALNQYGIEAPEALFLDREAELDRLISEQLFRIVRSEDGIRRGHFFHTRITKALYESIVPLGDVRRQAEDLARGFDAILERGEGARQFLDWLSAPKTQRVLRDSVRTESLITMWHVLYRRGPADSCLSTMRQWLALAIEARIDLGALGTRRVIREWWRNAPTDTWQWGILFQMTWDVDHSRRDEYCAEAHVWLDHNRESNSWTWVWQRLWRHQPDSEPLLQLGLQWMRENESHAGWSYVWQAMFDGGFRFPELLTSALSVLRTQPENVAELHVWRKAATMVADRSEFLDLVIRRLLRQMSRYKIEKAVALVREQLTGEASASIVLGTMAATLGQGRWLWVWYGLAQGFPTDKALHALGRNWLSGRDNSREWRFVWQSLVELDFELDSTLRAGNDWLKGREDGPDWHFVWQRLVDLKFDQPRLLSVGIDWLDGRDEHPSWIHVWQQLVTSNVARLVILRIGRDWLIGREDRAGWADVWERLVKLGYETTTLLPMGRAWLEGREDHPVWGKILTRLIEQGFEPHTLAPIGRAWLESHGDHPGWNDMWRRLINLNSDPEKVLPIGRAWLVGREERPNWSKIWSRLVELEFDHESLLPTGRDWLSGREANRGWTFIWTRLFRLGFDHDYMLRAGHEWLVKRAFGPACGYVLRDLIKAEFECEELLPRARRWLVDNPDQPGWGHVWRVVHDCHPGSEDVLSMALNWLIAHRDRPEWPYVWHRLFELELHPDRLRAIGQEWLRRPRSAPGYSLVFSALREGRN